MHRPVHYENLARESPREIGEVRSHDEGEGVVSDKGNIA